MQHADFDVVRRGYDIHQVDAFLARMEERAAGTTQKRIDELEAALAEAKEKEEAVHLTLVAATRTREEMLAAAQEQIDTATAEAQAESDRIKGEAQHQAYEMITTARAETEAALEASRKQAEDIVAKAQAEADRLMSEAKTESADIYAMVDEESKRLIADRDAELAARSERFEQEHEEVRTRLAQWHAIATDLEARMSAIARGSLSQLTDVTAALSEHAEELQPTRFTASTPPPAPETESPTPYTPLYSPENSSADTTEKEEDEAKPRGSFYSRRSANLPRLGADAAGGVLSAVGALRPALESNEEGTDAQTDVIDLVSA